MPWYTNLDVPGQLAYGLQVWQISVSINLPILPNRSSNNDAELGTANVNGMVRLAESILNYSVLQLNLGQEDQIEWPLSRFPAGGGLVVSAATGGGVADAGLAATNNGMAQASNVLSLPEPIEMGRTQNLSAKIRLSPDVFAMIGSIAAPGVGAALAPYLYTIANGETPINAVLPMIPMMVQINLKGRRVKNTQYGQLVR
jgi:hypothetical protein